MDDHLEMEVGTLTWRSKSVLPLPVARLFSCASQVGALLFHPWDSAIGSSGHALDFVLLMPHEVELPLQPLPSRQREVLDALLPMPFPLNARYQSPDLVVLLQLVEVPLLQLPLAGEAVPLPPLPPVVDEPRCSPGAHPTRSGLSASRRERIPGAESRSRPPSATVKVQDTARTDTSRCGPTASTFEPSCGKQKLNDLSPLNPGALVHMQSFMYSEIVNILQYKSTY